MPNVRKIRDDDAMNRNASKDGDEDCGERLVYTTDGV
jgi:hypothetical protein